VDTLLQAHVLTMTDLAQHWIFKASFLATLLMGALFALGVVLSVLPK